MNPCYCGHMRRHHINWQGLCLTKGCPCLVYRQPPLIGRPKPTAQGVRAPGGGEALPIQGQSEGTP